MNQNSNTGRDAPSERRYRKPPVIEALCEIVFSGSSWDDTVPGLFYERIKNNYPSKRQRTVQQAQITLGPEQAFAGVRHLPPVMQFASDEKHRVIQVARDLLVVNQLTPYPHFWEWEPDIVRCFRIYRELAQPKKVARLGLRYLNRVVLPGPRVLLEDYFRVYPSLPEEVGEAHGSFLLRVEVPQRADGHTVLITFGSAPAPPDEEAAVAFMLDLYDIREIQDAIDEDTMMEEVRRAHENIVVAFENSITGRLRGLFEPEEVA